MFKKRNLSIELTLPSGTTSIFNSPESGNDFTMDINISKGGEPAKNSATVKIYGLTQNQIAEFTFLNFGNPPLALMSNIKIQIKSDGAIIYKGNIVRSYGDYSDAPNIALFMYCISNYTDSINSPPTLSIKGGQDIVSVYSSIAEAMGLVLKNNGVSGTVENINLQNDTFSRLIELSNLTNTRFQIDDEFLNIFNPDFRGEKTDLTISKDNGLLGYPTFSDRGINFKCEFNLNFKIRSIITINSVVPKASGNWKILSLNYILSNRPAGDWVVEVETIRDFQ